VDERTPPLNEAAPAAGLDVAPGPKLASGRDADVFDLGNGQVLRRNRVASKTSELEAEIMRYVRAQGYPVPGVYEVSGPDMVVDRVDGPTMLKDLAARPWMVWRHARLLARLHRRLHTIAAPDWIPTYASHPAFAASDDGSAVPAGASAASPESSAPDTILHLDLHPDNVILSPRGPVVIDWRNTRRGAGAIDVATTWLIMATSQVPDLGLKRQVISLLRQILVYGFVHHAGRAEAARELPLAAHYRLADRNLLPSERPAIHALVRRVSAAH
jgi:aminoglycoside phosphotransferase (APT) family kinase protein